MKQNFHQFMRAMLFIAVLFMFSSGAAASMPALLAETELTPTNNPTIMLSEGVGKYTVRTSAVVGSEVYCRINSGEWFRYKKPLVFDEYGSYQVEAYATSYQHSPSATVSQSFVVDEHTGENLVDPDADDPSIIFHEGFKYRINGSTVSLTRQTDDMCSGELIIPSSITHNGVTYPVTEVESWACYSTNNITYVQIPSTVTTIGMYAFNSCPKLRAIDVDPDNPNYCDVDGVLYNKAGTYLYSYPNARSTHYTIPDGVIMIYYSAFQEDFDLESVTIPNSVISIRTSAFSCCSSLKSIALPSNLSVFDAGVFSSCRELKSVTFPSTINKIPEWGFSGCVSLESVVIPANVRTIADWAFEDCWALKSVTINEGTRTIMQYAFKNCRSLQEITIPSTVTSIGESVFYRCTSLTDIHINSGNNYYCEDDGVLYNKNKTTLIAYPPANPRVSYDILPTTQTIYASAFESCAALEHINIPSGLTTTGKYAFARCTNLKSIVLPKSLTSMGPYAFSYCTGLTKVTLENGFKVLGVSAFESCKSLTDINLVEGLTTIGEQAFRGCTSLAKLNIPNSVTSIGGWTFYMCSGLTSINIPPSLTTIPSSLLRYCSSLKEVTIPAGVTSIGSYAFQSTPLAVLNCLAETPPTIDEDDSFDYNNYHNTVVCVPPASLEAYRSAPFWSKFVSIRGIEAGDADGDGALSINDVTLMIDFLLAGMNDGSCFSANADANGDGVVNIDDITQLIDTLLNGN